MHNGDASWLMDQQNNIAYNDYVDLPTGSTDVVIAEMVFVKSSSCGAPSNL
jgi:hypothetical protein